MSIKKPYICLSTKLIYSSIIVALLGAILFMLFPLNELLPKKEVANNVQIINPTHVPPTDFPTPTQTPAMLFPDNPRAQKAYLILLASPYSEYAAMSLYEGDKTDYFKNSTQMTYIELKEESSQESESTLILEVTFPSQAVGGIVQRRFAVNIDTTKVEPVFVDKQTILKPSFSKVQIPHTNKSFMMPSSFTVTNGEKLSFENDALAANSYFCSLGTWADAYCKKLKEYLGSDAETIAERYVSGYVTTLKWDGLPHEWALDNVAWQGRTYRETKKEYPDFIGSETVTLGNNNFYKIGQGCCGDVSYSYLTKGFDENGTPLLITFIVNGYRQTNEKTRIETFPYLEEILKTMN